MSMEKYKGFILQDDSHTSEDTYYDGHRNEGTGRYSTNYFVRIIDVERSKSIVVTNTAEAKSLIDKWFSVEAAANTKELLASYETKKTELAALEANVAQAKYELRELYDKLPPKWSAF